MAALYNENSLILQKIKKMNTELESLDNQTKFHEDSIEEDATATNAEEGLELFPHEDSRLWEDPLPQVYNVWLSKEDQLREILMQQVLHLSRDLRLLQHQQHPLPRHLWGHATRLWRSSQQSSAPCRPSPSGSTGSKLTRKAKLLRWMNKKLIEI